MLMFSTAKLHVKLFAVSFYYSNWFCSVLLETIVTESYISSADSETICLLCNCIYNSDMFKSEFASFSGRH